MSLVQDSSLSHSKPARMGFSSSSSCCSIPRSSAIFIPFVQDEWRDEGGLCTFFLNCLWIASNASLIVTPFRFRAVTSRPRGKWRSIFLTGGVVRCFLRTSLSSSVAGEVFSFLCRRHQQGYHGRVSCRLKNCMVRAREGRRLASRSGELTSSAFGSPWQSLAPCPPFLPSSSASLCSRARVENKTYLNH